MSLNCCNCDYNSLNDGGAKSSRQKRRNELSQQRTSRDGVWPDVREGSSVTREGSSKCLPPRCWVSTPVAHVCVQYIQYIMQYKHPTERSGCQQCWLNTHVLSTYSMHNVQFTMSMEGIGKLYKGDWSADTCICICIVPPVIWCQRCNIFGAGSANFWCKSLVKLEPPQLFPVKLRNVEFIVE